MSHFAVGDRVIIRFGKQQGQNGTILKCQTGDTYTVRLEDGSVQFFSGKGLEPSPEKTNTAVVDTKQPTASERVPHKEAKTTPRRSK